MRIFSERDTVQGKHRGFAPKKLRLWKRTRDVCASRTVMQAGPGECAGGGKWTGEVLWKPEKAQWCGRLREERNRGDEMKIAASELGLRKGRRVATDGAVLWGRRAATAGGRRPVTRFWFCLARNPAPLLTSCVALSKFPHLPDSQLPRRKQGDNKNSSHVGLFWNLKEQNVHFPKGSARYLARSKQIVSVLTAPSLRGWGGQWGGWVKKDFERIKEN